VNACPNGLWLRLYTDLPRNRKMRMLAVADQLLFVWLLCLHKEGRLVGADMKALAFELHLDMRELHGGIRRLRNAGLLLKDNAPKGWGERQFVSDSSTQRSRKHREKVAATATQQPCNVARTVPETETETETETECRTGARGLFDSLVTTGKFPGLREPMDVAHLVHGFEDRLTPEVIEAVARDARTMPEDTIRYPASWIPAAVLRAVEGPRKNKDGRRGGADGDDGWGENGPCRPVRRAS
jgi:hypothetical protein